MATVYTPPNISASLIADVEQAIWSREGKKRGKEIVFRCPVEGHEDRHPSARWNPENAVWTCDPCVAAGRISKGTGAIDLARRLGIPLPTKPGPVLLTSRRRIVATYDYDVDGDLLHQTVRYEPKTFRQRRPDGHGGWIWSLQGIEPVLYHVDEIRSADPDEMVHLCAGEKDADRLRRHELLATTAPMGEGKWRDSYTNELRGRRVALYVDNDPAGEEHLQRVAPQLTRASITVIPVRLPGLLDKGDVSDWLDMGHSVDDLLVFIDEQPEWETGEPAGTDDVPRERPQLDAGNQDIAYMAEEGWRVIQQANNPPRLFRFGDSPVRVGETGDDAAPLPQPLNEDRMGYELANAAEWIKVDRHGEARPAAPPPRVIKNMLAAPSYPLPHLVSIVRTPVFAPDGSLQMEPGYHDAGRTFYAPSPGFTVPRVPKNPSVEDIQRAKALIVDELLGEFPFVDQSERANAVALVLDPYIRNLIEEPTPLRLIEAPTPGSGKGLLADVALRIATGTQNNIMPAANDDDEWRKRITAQLMQVPAAIQIDNLTSALDSGALAAALTAQWWNDRRLGANEMIRIPVRCIWLATANNPTMSTELARRTIRIRLDPKVDRPWQRTGFRHDDLRGWTSRHRSDLVWASLTLVQAWVAKGQPMGTIKLGSFERWAAVQAGILEVAGIDGFLSNLEEFYESADIEGAIWRQMIDLWFEKYGEAEVGVADLFDIAQGVEGFDFGKGSERAQKTSFGMALNRQRDRVIGDCRVTQTRMVRRVKKWRLIKSRPGGNPFDVFHQGGVE